MTTLAHPFTLLSWFVMFFKLLPHKFEISSSMQMFVVFLINIFSFIRSKILFYNESWPSPIIGNTKCPLWTINFQTSAKKLLEKSCGMNFPKKNLHIHKKISIWENSILSDRNLRRVIMKCNLFSKTKFPSNPSLEKKKICEKCQGKCFSMRWVIFTGKPFFWTVSRECKNKYIC